MYQELQYNFLKKCINSLLLIIEFKLFIRLELSSTLTLMKPAYPYKLLYKHSHEKNWHWRSLNHTYHPSWRRLSICQHQDYCDTMSWIYAHICIHTCVCAPIPVCVCVYVYMYMCVCAHAHTHLHACTRTRTYTHIYMWRDELDSAWVSNFKC